MFAPPVARTKPAPPRGSAVAARRPLFPAPRLPVPAKLEVGRVDDPLEREADRVAGQVMRMAAPGVSAAAPLAAAGEAPQIVREALGSPGQPLDAATRAYFEPRFGRDFSRVRVHTDEPAAASARAIRALAYTAGNDVVFAGGRYSPATGDGRQLLAHELAHVVQQSGSIARQPDPKPPLDPNKDVTTVDAAGKIQAGQIDSAAGKGVWRVPVLGLQKDKKGWAVALAPNIGAPAASSDKDVPVDVLLHLHGFGAGYRQLKKGEQDFAGVLQPGQLRDVDLYEAEQQLLSNVQTTKRFVVAVLPQGSPWSDFGDIGADADAYLNDVFKQLVPKFLPKGAVPGRVTVSGHSGGGPTVSSIAGRRTKAGKRTDVFLFDAINFGCIEKVPVMKDDKPVLKADGTPKMVCKDDSPCGSNEYTAVRDWVLDRIQADVKGLPAKPADHKSWLEANGARFRGFTSESLKTKNTCSYGFWYNKLKGDIDPAIDKLPVGADAKAQLHLNYVVKEAPGPHENLLAHGSLKAALAD